MLIKRFLSVVISLVIVSGTVQLPVFASDSLYEQGDDNSAFSDGGVPGDVASSGDVYAESCGLQGDELEPMAEEQNTFKASFDNLISGAAFNAQNGAYNYYSTSFSYYNQAGSNGSGSVSRAVSKTSVNIVERSEGNNAVKFTTNASSSDSVYIGSDNVGQKVTSADIIHYSFSLKTDDMNCVKQFSFKDASYGYLWNFLKFDVSGNIIFHSKIVDTYEVGKWYDVDMYYEAATGVWHLFINNKFVERMKYSCAITNLNVMRIGWVAPENVTTTVYIDNLVSDYADTSDLKGLENIESIETIPFAKYPMQISSSAKYDSGESVNLKYPNYVANNAVKFETGAGKFGKTQSDRALHIYNNAGYYSPLSFGFSDYTFPLSGSLEKGDKLYYAVSFALDNNTSNSFWIQAILSGNRPTFFEVDASGEVVKLMGSTVSGLTISKNKWYKLEFVMTVGENGVSNNSVDVYLNGKKINSQSLYFTAGSSDKLAMTGATIRTASYLTSQTANPSDTGYVEGYNKYAANSFWVDDIVSAVYPSGKSIISPLLTFMNPNVTIYSDRVENVGTLTVDEFINCSYVNMPFYIADSDGNEITDTSVPAKGTVMVITPLLGGNIYIPIYNIPLPSDYTQPSVEITAPSDGSRYVYGIDKSLTIKADAQAYSTIECVSIYLDDELLVKDTAYPYEYNWIISNVPGNHVIKAEVVDYYGSVALSNEITINVRVNQPPIISFTGIEEENSIYSGNEISFDINVQDTDGTVSKTELYLNNEIYDTFTDASNSYTLSFNENGRYLVKAVSYDELGEKSEKEYVVNVLKRTTVDVASVDFEGYSVGKKFSNSETISNNDFTGSAIIFSGDRGTKEIANDNGNNYLKSGVTAETFVGSSTPYIAAEYRVANAVVEYETDIMFSRNDVSHSANCRGESKTGTALHMYAFRFNEEGKLVVQNGSSYVEVGSYEPNTWYRLKIKFDIQNHKLDLSLENLSDPTDKCEAVGHNFQYSDYYKIHHIRIEGSFTDVSPGFIAYDNIVMKYTANYPSVSKITDENGTLNGVGANAESLYCEMTEPVGEITMEDVILENEYGKVSIESVSTDGKNIIITPADGFVSSSNYKLTIMESAPLADGNSFGFDTTVHFDVKEKSFDIVGGSFKSASSGTEFVADIVNTSGQEKTVTLVVTGYNGDTLISVYSKTVSVLTSGEVSGGIVPIVSGCNSLKAFVITNWESGVPVSAKSFKYTIE